MEEQEIKRLNELINKYLAKGYSTEEAIRSAEREWNNDDVQ